ncbi:MAG: SWIM zinc finger family protein [Leptolyngbyaceae cyanobacterium MAG.088]|nr:SWIM zinc finger family protein [Leptolyngbyaceae cyanobacterium MAG.088]
MAQFSRSWWGQQFISAIEKLTDSGRLSRGRSYARGKKVKGFDIDGNLITAQVRGSVNPYFGVYKEPLYFITIEFQPLSKAKWSAAVALMASKASIVSRLLLNEIPDNIEDTFAQLNLNLLPGSRKDFKTSCSCPDWSNPCKHIAGVYYLVAAELDQDPFLLFELRGLSRQDLFNELAKSPLGKALSAELQAEQAAPQPAESYYTSPETLDVPKETELREFWHGKKQLPQTMEALPENPVSAIAIKKQGDYPAFWHRDNSFITAMETLYEQVKARGQL